MSRRRKRLLLWLAGLGMLAAAVVAPPLVDAGRFAARIRQGLEGELGRQVTVGSVRLRLFPAPGFWIEDVVIQEDPAWGIEPVAYVTTLVARPKLSSLWTGRLEFSSLHLDEPSLNLVRVVGPNGVPRWNFESLLARAATTRLPAISIDFGRVNFKFGSAKSVFYFTNAQGSVRAPADGAKEWRIEFSGEPARTDRAAHGFGRLEGRVRWLEQGKLDADLRLEQSAVVEMATLVYGRDVGVHGLCSARVRAAGTVDDLKIDGRLQIDDVHRWDMMPPHGGGWVLGVTGRTDLRRQSIDLTASPPGPSPVLTLRFRALEYLGSPRWAMVASFSRLPLESLVEVGRHMGAPIPATLSAAGAIEGALGYSGAGGFAGRMAFYDMALGLPRTPAVRFDRAVLVFDGPRVRLLPSVARTEEDEARIEAAYYWNTQLVDVTLSTEGMRVASPGSRAVLASVPLLQHAMSGAWHGYLRCQILPGGGAAWTGRAGLEDAAVAAPGFSEPLWLDSASVRLFGRRVVVSGINGRLGAAEWLGDYLYDPRLARPHRFRLTIPELSAGQAERLLLPTLRRSRGFLARTLGMAPAAPPDWLKSRHAEGTFRIGSLDIGPLVAEQVRGRVAWDADAIEIGGLSALAMGGKLNGSLSLNLKAAAPAYQLRYRLEDAEWKGGTLSSEGALNTSGTGAQTLANLDVEGSFEGHAVALDPATAVDGISGSYRITWRSQAPVLRFPDLQVDLGEARYSGKGASLEDGALVAELTSGTRQLRLTGTLAQMKLDVSPISAP